MRVLSLSLSLSHSLSLSLSLSLPLSLYLSLSLSLDPRADDLLTPENAALVIIDFQPARLSP